MNAQFPNVMWTFIFIYLKWQMIATLPVQNENQDLHQSITVSTVLQSNFPAEVSFPRTSRDSYGNLLPFGDEIPNRRNGDKTRVVEANGYLFEIPGYASGITDIRPPLDELLPPSVSVNKKNQPQENQTKGLLLKILPPLPISINLKEDSRMPSTDLGKQLLQTIEKATTQENYRTTYGISTKTDSHIKDDNEVSNRKPTELHHNSNLLPDFSTGKKLVPRSITPPLALSKPITYPILINIPNESLFSFRNRNFSCITETNRKPHFIILLVKENTVPQVLSSEPTATFNTLNTLNSKYSGIINDTVFAPKSTGITNQATIIPLEFSINALSDTPTTFKNNYVPKHNLINIERSSFPDDMEKELLSVMSTLLRPEKSENLNNTFEYESQTTMSAANQDVTETYTEPLTRSVKTTSSEPLPVTEKSNGPSHAPADETGPASTSTSTEGLDSTPRSTPTPIRPETRIESGPTVAQKTTPEVFPDEKSPIFRAANDETGPTTEYRTTAKNVRLDTGSTEFDSISTTVTFTLDMLTPTSTDQRKQPAYPKSTTNYKPSLSDRISNEEVTEPSTGLLPPLVKTTSSEPLPVTENSNGPSEVPGDEPERASTSTNTEGLDSTPGSISTPIRTKTSANSASTIAEKSPSHVLADNTRPCSVHADTDFSKCGTISQTQNTMTYSPLNQSTQSHLSPHTSEVQSAGEILSVRENKESIFKSDMVVGKGRAIIPNFIKENIFLKNLPSLYNSEIPTTVTASSTVKGVLAPQFDQLTSQLNGSPSFQSSESGRPIIGLHGNDFQDTAPQEPGKIQKYTGGFGGPAGILGEQSTPGYAIQADGSVKDPDHRYNSTSAPVIQTSEHFTSSNKHDKYTGGFGGPPGILTPYDNNLK